ncbi:MAG: Bax inhibitor-1/YccA family protein [Myxococcales bacterium]
MPANYPFPVSPQGLPSDARPYALDQEARSAFLRKVYGLVLLGVAATGIGGVASLETGVALYFVHHLWMALGLFFGLFLACQAWRRTPGLNLLLLVGFTGFSGVLFAPAALFAGPAALGNALLATGVAFAGLSVYGTVTRRDFSFLRGFLLTSLIAVIAVALGNLFLFKSSAVDGALAAVECFVFSGFILFDTQRLMRTQSMDDPVGFALAIYLDIVNLFLALLNLFSRRR